MASIRGLGRGSGGGAFRRIGGRDFAKADLPLDAAEVLNMRVQSAEEVCAALFNGEVKPNLPQGKVTATDAPKSPAA